jgi:hypothetical protein
VPCSAADKNQHSLLRAIRTCVSSIFLSYKQ